MATPDLAAAQVADGVLQEIGCAFGISVVASTPMPGLVGGACRSGRRVEWRHLSASAQTAAWQPRHARVLVEERHEDGAIFMRVEFDPELGYRLLAPGFGDHLVSADGSCIRSAFETRGGGPRWRFLYAQVLPLAAALNGLELFHASSVEIGGRAFAFIAPPGTGKTSIALHLTAAGAPFLTDDLLALEIMGDGVYAHPGVATMRVTPNELERLDPSERGAFRPVLRGGEDDKIELATEPVSDAPRLGGVLFLRRTRGIRTLEIRREPAHRVHALLAAAFLAFLRQRERLAIHLDVCARIAASVPTFAVEIPRDLTARETALCLRERIEATL